MKQLTTKDDNSAEAHGGLVVGSSLILILAIGASILIPDTCVAGWTAFNDCAWLAGEPQSNVTLASPAMDVDEPSAANTVAYLKDAQTAGLLPVQAEFIVVNGTCSVSMASFPAPAESSDAFRVFDGRLQYTNDYVHIPFGMVVTLRLSNLGPTKRYSVALFSTRGRQGDSYSQRLTDVTLTGADAFANNSSADVVRRTVSTTNDSGRVSSDNLDGRVVRFDGVDPGLDGTISLLISSGSGSAYINAFMLQEVDSYVPSDVVPTMANGVFMPLGGAWRYNDKGKDFGTDWRTLAYSDQSWSNGPASFGYGGLFNATVVGYATNAATASVAR